MFKKILVVSLAAAAAVSCGQSVTAPVDYTQYVDPFIGTAYTGHTYPAATTPFGMVQVGPDNGTDGWQFCSGYHDSSSSIIGFSHTHLNGTGCPDMGDILFMPAVGCTAWEAGTDEDPSAGYRSRFSTSTEEAAPDYYKVFLEDYGVTAEMTATHRVGMHRYTFPADGDASVIIDLTHGLDSETTDSYIKVVDDNTILGYRRSSGFVKDHWYFFCARFDKPFTSTEACPDMENRKIRLHFSSGREFNTFLYN